MSHEFELAMLLTQKFVWKQHLGLSIGTYISWVAQTQGLNLDPMGTIKAKSPKLE